MSTAIKVLSVAALMAIAALWGSNPLAWSIVMAIIASVIALLALSIYALRAISGAILQSIAKGCSVIILVGLLLGGLGIGAASVLGRFNTHPITTQTVLGNTPIFADSLLDDMYIFCDGNTIYEDDNGLLECTNNAGTIIRIQR